MAGRHSSNPLISAPDASLHSVRAFAAAFQEKCGRLDVLMNNAAMSAPPRQTTDDGFELQFGVNHLGHFALMGLLLDVLLQTPGSRLGVVSSRMHEYSQMVWDDLMGEERYSRWQAYGRSKLANLLLCIELLWQLEAAGGHQSGPRWSLHGVYHYQMDDHLKAAVFADHRLQLILAMGRVGRQFCRLPSARSVFPVSLSTFCE